MITTGVTGWPWRASVTSWGAVEPWDGRGRLDWYVAADDRWHVPAVEAAVRQRRVDGTAVVETRLRVPDGDAVHRVWSVPDGPGYTVIEVFNESTRPIAVAFDRGDLRTERAVPDLPVQGIELPAGSFVLPVGHRAAARVAIAHDGSGAGRLPPGLPGWEQVARGWATTCARAARYDVPDVVTSEAVTAWRCELSLGALARADADPSGFAVGLAELVRLGDDPDPWLPELVAAIESLGPEPGWAADVGLEAGGRVLAAAAETRAGRDLDRILARRPAVSPSPEAPPDDVLVVPWFEGRLARRGALLPGGIPTAWLGAALEAHDVPVGPATTVSFGVRWHGARPAVLWELSGAPLTLTAPAMDPTWRTDDVRGEALWPAPAGDGQRPAGADTAVEPTSGPGMDPGTDPIVDDGPVSFS